MALLRVDNMTHYFGGLRAVHKYSLILEPGHIVGLIAFSTHRTYRLYRIQTQRAYETQTDKG